MLVLLVLSLLVMFIAVLYLTEYQLLSPSIVLIVGFSMISLASLYLYVNSGITIELTTYLIIMLSILFFMFGEGSARVTLTSFRRTMPLKSNSISIANYEYRIPQKIMLVMIFIAIFTCVEQIKYTLEAGKIFFPNGSTLKLIAASRICSVNPLECESVSFNLSAKIGLLLTKSIAYFSVYLLIFNHSQFKNNRNAYSLYLLIFIFSVQMLLSTARTGFIYFIIYSFSIWGFYKYSVTPTNKQATKKILKKAIKVFSISCVLFYLLGFFTAKSSSISLVDMLVGYTGFQIFALDLYLNNCTGGCVSIGTETFNGVRATLYKLGLINTWIKPTLGFVEFGDGNSTNIYTAIRRVVADFSLTGSFFYFYGIGFFYGILFKNIRLGSNSGFYITMYSMTLFPVFMSAWDERFSNVMLSNFMILNVFILYLFFRFFKKV
jgi:oligosaccharide repeat unit polymerase